MQALTEYDPTQDFERKLVETMIDIKNTSGTDWQNLSPEEKKKELYKKQKATLDMFLERGAITQAQYDKSLGDLTEKMGMR